MKARVYLDTCIVSALVRNQGATQELHALDRILEAHKDGTISLLTSQITKDEVIRIPEKFRRAHTSIYNLLTNVSVAKGWDPVPPFSYIGLGDYVGEPKPLRRKLLQLLPDASDAEHLYQAAENDIDFFLTRDRRSILRYAVDITELCGLKVVDPVEFVKLI